MRLLKRTPFIILAVFSVGLVGLLILQWLGFYKNIPWAFEMALFFYDPQNLFFVYHWLVIIFWAIFLATILTISKNYRVWEAVIGIGGNLILLVLMFIPIIRFAEFF